MLTTRDTTTAELLRVGSAITKVKTFIRGPYNNLWIEDHLLTVYLRKGLHCQPGTGEPRKCLDIGNVQVARVGHGTFSAWIALVEVLAREEGFEALYVESVLTRKFAAWFIERDRWIKSAERPPSFMLLLA